MLALEIMMEEKELDNDVRVISSRAFMWFLIFKGCGWNENQSEKVSMSQFPGSNSSSKGEKEG